MANTPNYNLYKPSRADTSVEVDTTLSNNFTIIDTELKSNKDGLDTHKNDVLAHASDKISHADGSVKTVLDNHEERLGGLETDTEGLDTRVTDIETLGLDKLAPNLEGRIQTIESDVEGILAPATFDAIQNQSYTFDEYRIGYVADKLNEIEVNAKTFGAKGDGLADDTQAIIDAEAYAVSLGTDARLFIPRGLYKITGTIKIRCALDADQATIRYYGTGTALVIGDDSATGIVTARRRYHLPRVINMNRGSVVPAVGTVGVKCVNLNTCEVYIPFVQDFEQGLVLWGYGQGVAYSTFYLGALWENRKNLVLDGDATSWVNQNLFFNGRLQQSVSKGYTLDDVNTNQIYMGGTIQPNNNTFINTSIEGENIAYYRADISGRFNKFYNCRWEGQNGALPRVRYRSTAYSNSIDGGYDANKIVETFDAGALGGEIQDGSGAYVSAFNTSGQVLTTGVTTAINTWGNIVSRRIAYNATTGEFTPRAGRWKISATVCFAPNATGRRIAFLTCAGSTRDVFEAPGNAIRTSLKVEDVYKFDGSQTFIISAQQTSGANLALETTSGYVKLQAEYLGN